MLRANNFFLILFFFPASLVAFELEDKCPKWFKADQNGLCQIDIPYFYTQNKTGYTPQLQRIVQSWSPQEISLGKIIFFDKFISGDQKRSCASCHQPQRAFSDGLKRSLGKNDISLSKSAPTLWNVIFKTKFNWEGNFKSLFEQNVNVLLDPQEMATSRDELENKLNNHNEYKLAFKMVYGNDEIKLEQVVEALIAFQASLLSFGSKYDDFALGNFEAFSDEEFEGFNVFRSFLSRCSECHTPPLFTNHQILATGVDPSVSKSHQGFVIPTLRNIEFSAPYMHQGQHLSLEEVVEFYDRGGGRGKTNVHWHIRPIGLSKQEKKSLVAFLKTLTDQNSVTGN